MATAKSLLLAGLTAGLVAGAAQAGPELVDYPEGFEETFVNYVTIDRRDNQTIRVMYANPEAVDAAAPGQTLPDGTILVMADFKPEMNSSGLPLYDADGRYKNSGELVNVFVMEKQPGWGEEYPSTMRNGEWEYARFNTDGSRVADQDYAGCFGCHLNRIGRDYTFTFWKWVSDEKG